MNKTEASPRFQRLVLFAIVGLGLAVLGLGVYVAGLRYSGVVTHELRSRGMLGNIRPGMSQVAVEAALREGPLRASSIVTTTLPLNRATSPSAGGQVVRYQVDSEPPFSVIYSATGKVVTVMPAR
ncbi:hypothetical protein BH09VER1_BH09VER1_43660 [soil metagenome]